MSERMEATPKKQYRRVAAWIYTVINPVIDSLQREGMLLDLGNLTWRPSSGRCEFIKPIQEYVDVRQWPNYYDYRADHTVFVSAFAGHDTALESLNAGAKRIYDWIISWNEFSSEVELMFARYEREKPGTGPQYPSFINSRAELPKVAAVLNCSQSLKRY
jgi:hypothetical protein